MKDKGFIIPGLSWVRVDRSPIPDIGYIVNSEYMLESPGEGEPSMSLMGAPRGVYDPREALRGASWSINFLNLGEH
ncbi:MAG: hypothetical protein AABW73_04805 [Nanoarchaeota archaeon]